MPHRVTCLAGKNLPSHEHPAFIGKTDATSRTKHAYSTQGLPTITIPNGVAKSSEDERIHRHKIWTVKDGVVSRITEEERRGYFLMKAVREI